MMLKAAGRLSLLLFLVCAHLLSITAQDVQSQALSCEEDRLRYCPEVQHPYTYHDLLASNCYTSHRQQLSLHCRSILDRFANDKDSVWAICHEDFEKYCPNLKPAFTAPAILDTWCFKQHHKHLNPMCRKAYDQYHHNKGPLLPPYTTVNSIERVCGKDRVKYCPEVTVPYTAHDLFDRECFLTSVRHLSPDCRHMMLEHLRKHSVLKLIFTHLPLILVSTLAISCLITLSCLGCYLCCLRKSSKEKKKKQEAQPYVPLSRDLEDEELANAIAESLKQPDQQMQQTVRPPQVPSAEHLLYPQYYECAYTTSTPEATAQWQVYAATQGPTGIVSVVPGGHGMGLHPHYPQQQQQQQQGHPPPFYTPVAMAYFPQQLM